MTHAQGILAQLRKGERHPDTPEDLRERLADRADELEGELADRPSEVANVLLSIHPEHAEAILAGEKHWEYRRQMPARELPMRFVLYATGVQESIGDCWAVDVIEGLPEHVVERTIDATPHGREDVLAYFDGAYHAHAIQVVEPRRFETPIDRRAFEVAGRAPTQNFRYLPDIPVSYAELRGVV